MTVLSRGILPSGDSVFFSNWCGPEELPSPDQVRQHSDVLSSNRNIVVRFSHLKLIVKYGSCVREAEGQALWVVKQFTDIAAPTVYGWFQDGDEMFLYMSLEEGVTLASRWSKLLKEEKADIANQLKGMFASVSKVKLPPDELYIGLPDSLPITLTHNDLNFTNILVSPHGSQVTAVIDWELAGFYPSYWEWVTSTAMNEIRGGDIKHFMDTILKPHDLIYRHWSHWFRSTGA
ncbi:hypothetical protein GALMADRAFT_281432 [Galerina marginata CBS 339.88]|uniref:Aminoglycoside phosphotransferase domain-containing protein n=1 Tax=Galerina marginata (strain CBS 339.88) TaxID=685588 RepID=A0A067T144_GALM3|nr:hypothetical protein GALMADRAFT_281432 [Galerina marginata CBS 339.88]